MANRPEFNPTTGQRIRYQNSPLYDWSGTPIQYGSGPEDNRSDPYLWNQETGLRAGQTVTVNNPVGMGGTPPPPQDISVTTVAYEGYDTPPVIRLPAGSSISGIKSRSDVRNRLSLSNDVVATVDNVSRDDSYVPSPGSVVVFRERNKRRG